MFFCTVIRRRTTNRWRQQAPRLYYWNLYVERQRRRGVQQIDEDENSSSEQKVVVVSSCCHISPPLPSRIYYITADMGPQQSSSGQKAGTLNHGIEETKHLFDITERILPIGTYMSGTKWSMNIQSTMLGGLFFLSDAIIRICIKSGLPLVVQICQMM